MHQNSFFRHLLGYFFSFRLPILVVAIFVIQILIIHNMQLRVPLEVMLLPLVLAPAILFFWARFLYVAYQKDIKSKFEQICHALKKVDYWYYFGSDAIGVEVKSKVIHLVPSEGEPLTIELKNVSLREDSLTCCKK